MPDTIVKYLLNEANNKTKKHTIVRKINGPDETFFQTMIMNSEYGREVELNSPETVEQNCKTYANFIVDGKPVTGHPYILNVSSFEKLKRKAKEGVYFARKFDLDEDNQIFDLIDEFLLLHMSN